PGSAASSPAVSTSNTFAVGYSTVESGAGIKEVELWAQAPGDSGYSLAATDATPASPSFAYTAAAGDGSYRFYTRARDNAGNYEDAPASPPDSTTVVDTQSPQSAASSPALTSSKTFTVGYIASDSGPAGVKEVELWVQAPGDSG